MARFFSGGGENPFPFGASSICQILKQAEESGFAGGAVVPQALMGGSPRIPPEFPVALREVVYDTAAGALEYLDQVESIIPSLAMDFLDTPGLEAFQNLVQLYQGLHCVTVLMDMLTGSIRVNLEGVLLEGISVSEHRRRFISILKRLIDCQVKRDFSQIPELLQMEIAALLPVWKEMFGVVLKKITAE
jgi:flagellin-specific chaperone FliS